jgi:hypothetical protein
VCIGVVTTCYYLDRTHLASLTHVCSGSEWHERDTSVTNCHPWYRNYLSLISHTFPDARAASRAGLVYFNW